MYGGITFQEGKTDQDNLDTYRLIRHGESPKSIDVHFVNNEIDPTGMGEPAFPPVFAAVANALYRSTGQRYYHQPFLQDI
jgi:isoquinoline 1-oxidoreductase beta subunit